MHWRNTDPLETLESYPDALAFARGIGEISAEELEHILDSLRCRYIAIRIRREISAAASESPHARDYPSAPMFFSTTARVSWSCAVGLNSMTSVSAKISGV